MKIKLIAFALLLTIATQAETVTEEFKQNLPTANEAVFAASQYLKMGCKFVTIMHEEEIPDGIFKRPESYEVCATRKVNR